MSSKINECDVKLTQATKNYDLAGLFAIVNREMTCLFLPNPRLILALLFLLPWLCRGQAVTGEFENYRALTVETGLPSNDVRCFAKGPKGFMWIGTTNGLVRYDGSEVLVFQNDPEDSTSISGNHISVIEPEGDSIIWVGTYFNGLNKYNLKTGIFQRFIPQQGQPNSIPSKEIYALEHDKHGDLWVGYNRDGFGRYNPENGFFEQIRITAMESSYANRQNSVVNSFIVDPSTPDKIWVVTLKSLIEYNMDSGHLVRHSPYSGNLEGVENRLFVIHTGIRSREGLFYLACTRYGIWEYNPQNDSWKNYALKIPPEQKQPYDNSFNLIDQVDARTFWLSSKKRGLFALDIHTGKISPFEGYNQNSNGSLPHTVSAWYLKSVEGYWMGTDNGVKLFNKQANQFEIYHYSPEAKRLKGRQSISAIHQINKTDIYFGGYAGEGVYRYNFETGEEILIPPPEPIAETEAKMFIVTDFVPFNDTTLLVLAYNGLYRMNLNTEKLTVVNTGLKFGKDYNIFNRILKHSSGNFYISTRYSGIMALDSTLHFSRHIAFNSQRPSRSLVNSNYIYEICEDPNRDVWIGTENGFSRWNVRRNTFANFDSQNRQDSIPVLKTIYRILMAPDSSLWFIDAFDHGVYLEYPYKEPFDFKPIYTGNQGQLDRLNNVLFLHDGRTVYSTEAGLSIADVEGNFRLFTDKEGLPDMAPLASMAEMPDGRVVVVAARSNLVSFYPDSLYYTPKKNELHMSSITIFDKKLNANIDSVMQHGLELDYLQNFFTLKLGLLNFDNPEEYSLTYRLKGFSDRWITTPDKNAVFTNVPGGQYTFEARLIDKNNRIAQKTLTLPIIMEPPLWKTLWFRLLVIATVAGVALTFLLVAVRNARRKAAFNKELANMELISLRAQMNPHFIFNSLNSIRHQIITKKNDEAEKYLVKFSRLVRWILENSDAHYILLRDEINALRLYLELESKRFDDKFEYHLNIDPEIEPAKLKVPAIIVQPFVENAIWHGLMQKRKPGIVRVDFAMSETNLIIRITDDGIGRDKARELKSKTGQNRNSMGVKITASRLAAIEKRYNISCSASIEDLKNENDEPLGTRVILTLPIINTVTSDL